MQINTRVKVALTIVSLDKDRPHCKYTCGGVERVSFFFPSALSLPENAQEGDTCYFDGYIRGIYPKTHVATPDGEIMAIEGITYQVANETGKGLEVDAALVARYYPDPLPFGEL